MLYGPAGMKGSIMGGRAKRALTVLLSLVSAAAAWGQYSSAAPWGVGKSDPNDLTVQLVTIDPSEPLYTWWGHSGVIIRDEKAKAARFYNYGLFSFSSKNFVANTIMGKLLFRIAAFPVESALKSEADAGRAIRIQTLALPPEAKLHLALIMEHDISPGNNIYLYDHYRDNCTTRVRDALDTVLQGRLSTAGASPARMSLRDHTRRFTGRSFIMDWLLMFVMSGVVVDQPATKWQEMFLPLELERDVRLVTVPDGQGGEKPLVAEESVYANARVTHVPPETPVPGWPPALAVGLALAACALLPAWRLRRKKRGAEIAFGACSSLIGLVFGGLGALLFFVAAFTDHSLTYWNENLFLVNPLTLAALPLGIMAARRWDRWGAWLFWLWRGLAAVAGLYLIAKLLPVLGQKNGQAIAMIAPLVFGLAATTVIARKETRRKKSVE
jgi:hypothetical protein